MPGPRPLLIQGEASFGAWVGSIEDVHATLAAERAGGANGLPDPGASAFRHVPIARTLTIRKTTPQNMSSPEELADLLARCALQDRRAFERLYQLASAKLFGLVLRIVKDEEFANDVLQDGFVRIWSHAGEFRPEKASAVTWMGSIMRNRAIDLLRRGKTRMAIDTPVEELYWLEDESLVSATAEVGRLQTNLALRRCLETLSESQRQAISLAYFRGLTHEELAQHLDKPLGTVKSWLRRGLLRLKDCLNER